MEKHDFPEFDSKGRFVESPCYGCQQASCDFCPRERIEPCFGTET